MAVNELVLDGLIESFEVAIRLRMFMVIEGVNEAAFPATLSKCFSNSPPSSVWILIVVNGVVREFYQPIQLLLNR
jgi:hypothetical protein